MNARVSRKSSTAIERGSRTLCTGEAKYTVMSATRQATRTPRAITHMSRVETYRHQRL